MPRTQEDSRDIPRSRFQYAPDYLARPRAIPIDPAALPLSVGPVITERPYLFGAFCDCCPDRWGEEIWRAMERENNLSLTYFDYLVSGATERIGAMAFGPDPDEPAWDHPPQQIHAQRTEADLEQLAGAADRFIKDGYHKMPEYLRAYLGSGPSVGGSRPKALITYQGLPCIAKFPFPKADDWNEPRIEYATMSLARKLGLDAPRVWLTKTPRLTLKGPGKALSDVFVIERFDRAKGQKLHFVSAKTVLQAKDFQKNISYQDLARACSKHGPPDGLEKDRREIFKRMVFNVLVNNEDDHLKNHGFIWSGDGFALSKLYDVVPCPVPTQELQLSLGKGGRNRGLDNAASDPWAFGLDPGQARLIIQEMSDSFYSNWKVHFKDCGVGAKDLSKLNKVLTPTLKRPASQS